MTNGAMSGRLGAALIGMALALHSMPRTAAAAPATNPVPVRINADQLKYDYENHIAYLRGNVVVRDAPGRMLSSDNATVYFGKKSTAAAADAADQNVAFGNVERIVAVGNVRMVDGINRVIADKGVWSKLDNKVVLTGGPPKAMRETAIMRATRIIYDLTLQKLQFQPRPIVEYDLSPEEKQRFLR
jgi:lipopolysaccharide export system protein LptA